MANGWSRDKSGTQAYYDLKRRNMLRLVVVPTGVGCWCGVVAQQQNPRLLGRGFAYLVSGALSPHPAANHRPEVSLGFFMTGTLATLAVWTTGAVFPVYTTVVVPKG